MGTSASGRRAARGFALVLVCVALCAVLLAAGGPGALLSLAPALLLLLALLRGRYPGERRLMALVFRGFTRRARDRAVSQRQLRDRRPIPRGGLLIASSLAVRPPPRPAALS